MQVGNFSFKLSDDVGEVVLCADSIRQLSVKAFVLRLRRFKALSELRFLSVRVPKLDLRFTKVALYRFKFTFRFTKVSL